MVEKVEKSEIDMESVRQELYKPRYEHYNRREREYMDGSREKGWNLSIALLGWVYYAYRRTYVLAAVTLLITVFMGIMGQAAGVVLTHITLGITGESMYIAYIKSKVGKLSVRGYSEEEIKSATRPNILIALLSIVVVMSIIFLIVLGVFLLGSA